MCLLLCHERGGRVWLRNLSINLSLGDNEIKIYVTGKCIPSNDFDLRSERLSMKSISIHIVRVANKTSYVETVGLFCIFEKKEGVMIDSKIPVYHQRDIMVGPVDESYPG